MAKFNTGFLNVSTRVQSRFSSPISQNRNRQRSRDLENKQNYNIGFNTSEQYLYNYA